jgi:hypothetical protein
MILHDIIMNYIPRPYGIMGYLLVMGDTSFLGSIRYRYHEYRSISIPKFLNLISHELKLTISEQINKRIILM